MDTVSSTVPDSPLPRKRRALWPWVVSSIVLLLAVLGLSFWWPMHRAGIVIQFLDENQGYYRVEYNHPEWTNSFLGKSTFHPWFDKIYEINTNSSGADDAFLKNLPSISGLKELELQIKPGSESSAIYLSKLAELKHLRLSGNHSSIPSQSLIGFENLEFVQLSKIILDDSLWKTVTEDLDVQGIALHNCRFEGGVSSPKSSKLTKLGLYYCELDESFGNAIAELSSLESLTIWGALNDDFLSELSSNRSVNSLGIYSGTISETGWEFICQIESLDTLSLRFPNSGSSDPGLTSLSSIRKLKKLRELHLSSDSLELEPNYDYLGDLAKLENLGLNRMKCSYELLWGIASIPHLRELHLGCYGVDNSGWLILANCKSLKKLTYTEDCSFRDVVEEFKTARHDVEVTQR